MKAAEFFAIYQRLDLATRDEMDEQMGEIARLEERRDDLIEHLNKLPSTERDQLKEDEHQFLADAKAERRDIETSAYAAADEDEAEMHRQSNIMDVDNHTYDIVTSTYPIGVQWLNDDIAAAQAKVHQLIEAAIRDL